MTIFNSKLLVITRPGTLINLLFVCARCARTLRRQMDRKRTVTKDPYNPEFKEAFQCLAAKPWKFCLMSSENGAGHAAVG